MSCTRCDLSRCLVLSMLASVGLCIPSARIPGIRARAGCPAGPNGPNYQILVSGDTCQTLAEKFNTSTLDTANLNFAGPNCTENFIAGHQVCIPPPCDAYTVQRGDTCQKIADSKKVVRGLDGFYGINPSLNNPSCSNLKIGSNVCLAAPNGTNHPNPVAPSGAQVVASGSTTTSVGTGISPAIHCTKNYTAFENDSCDGIASKFNLMHGTTNYFFALNPTVHNPSCNNINIDQVYCVANATTAAFPKATNNVKCTQEYQVKDGDGSCDKVAQINGLPNGAALQALNPTTINAKCSNLVIGMKYCVKGTNNPA